MARMSTRSLYPILALLLIAAHSHLTPALFAQEVPFDGIVAEDDVKVRAGAGRTFYIVGSLPKGTKVTVDEVIFGWNKVVPAAGVHSYISKAFVDAKGDGKDGVVNRDRAPVNAASLDGPGDSYRHQLDLGKGDSVKIVGEEGSFYKILPPTLDGTKKAYVYLPPGSVRREVVDVPKPATPEIKPEVKPEIKPDVTSPEVTKPVPPVTPTTPTTPEVKPEIKPEVITPAVPTAPATPVTPEVITPAVPVTPTTPTTPATPVAPADTKGSPLTPAEILGVPTPASLQKFEANHEAIKSLEVQMSESLRLPIAKQPIDELLAAYQTATNLQGTTAQDKFVCQMRIAQLTRIQKVQAAVKSSQVDLAADPAAEKEKPQGPDAQRAANYNATGQLLASSVYDGVRLPQLFRVVEPSSNRTIVYVRPGKEFETPKALGRLVGITGKIRFDSSLNLRIIEVEKLDILDIAEPATATPAAAPAVTDSVTTTIKVTQVKVTE